MKTINVTIQTVTPRYGDGTTSPTIIIISRNKGFTIPLLSNRLNNTGTLTQTLTGTYNTIPIVAATASIGNLFTISL